MSTLSGLYPHACDFTRLFRACGALRPPRAGEYYLSGAIVEAHRALHDLTQPYHIAEEVCGAQIDLSAPSGTERVRGFQPPWRTVFLYQCPKCKAQYLFGATAFSGARPVPSRGAFRCSATTPTSTTDRA